MNTICSTRRLPLFVLMLVSVALLAPGCGGRAPQEANDALAKVLTALAEDDRDGFKEMLVPDQRDGFRDVDEMAFFGSTMSSVVQNDADLEVTDTSAMILVKLFFDAEEKQFASVYFVMKVVEGKWLFDLAETIKKENEINPGYEFEIHQWSE
jgi:hypothetical protein